MAAKRRGKGRRSVAPREREPKTLAGQIAAIEAMALREKHRAKLAKAREHASDAWRARSFVESILAEWPAMRALPRGDTLLFSDEWSDWLADLLFYVELALRNCATARSIVGRTFSHRAIFSMESVAHSLLRIAEEHPDPLHRHALPKHIPAAWERRAAEHVDASP